jgi:hypothetical protein
MYGNVCALRNTSFTVLCGTKHLVPCSTGCFVYRAVLIFSTLRLAFSRAHASATSYFEPQVWLAIGDCCFGDFSGVPGP